MSQRYERERRVAVDAVREAGGLCRSVQAGISPAMLEKKDRSPVTVADFGSQALVCRMLAEAFADDPVIGEEDAAALRQPDHAELRDKVVSHVRSIHPDAEADTVRRWIDRGGTSAYSERFWTLDPIDGTKGFLRNEQYAIALALVVGGEVAVAALGCPNLSVEAGSPGGAGGAIFTAVRGGGAMVEPMGGGPDSPPSAAAAEPRPIHVSDTADPAAARFCESVESGHSSHSDAAEVARSLGITAEPVRLDSQAKYASVARGEADLYMRLPTRADYVEKIWDHAAGALVVEEAGGRVSDISGRPLAYTHGRGLEGNRGKGVIVSNGRLHDRVLAALTEVGVS